jgi:hypothetical protein
MGGLLRSLAVVRAARAARVGLVVGAQVGETSVLTRAALAVARTPAATSSWRRRVRSGPCCSSGTSAIPADVRTGGVLDVATYPALERPGFGLTV